MDHTGFGISAGSWMRLNSRYGMRLGTDGKCSINWDGHEEEELLLVPRQLARAPEGRMGRTVYLRKVAERF